MFFKNKEDLKNTRDLFFEFIQFEGMSKQEKDVLLESIEAYLKTNLDSETKIIVDHRESILKKARDYKKIKEFDYSRIFYFTYFEHTINQIIFQFCLSKKLDLKEQSEIIRSINLKGKFSWFLKILGFPEFNRSHLVTILNLSEKRNSFIHYKWKSLAPIDERLDEIERGTITKEFKEIEKSVRYLKTYCKKIKLDPLGLKKILQDIQKT